MPDRPARAIDYDRWVHKERGISGAPIVRDMRGGDGIFMDVETDEQCGVLRHG
jgi:hypothetical protein